MVCFAEMSPTDGQQSSKARKLGWRVVLGSAAWSRYTYERPAGGQKEEEQQLNKSPKFCPTGDNLLDIYRGRLHRHTQISAQTCLQ